MAMRELVLVGGGARSGKSTFALALARRLGQRRVLVATAEARDEEMARRIAQHQRQRGENFRTVEEPHDLAGALRRIQDADVVVVDCLTLWLANRLLRGDAEAETLERVEEVLGALRGLPGHAIVVTNEVGLGVVPETALGRAFRDLCGRAHQMLARQSDRVYLAALGCMLRLKPGPVEVEGWQEGS